MIISWDWNLPSRNVFVFKSRISTELRRTRSFRVQEESVGFADPPTMTISFVSFNKEQVCLKRQVLMSGPFVQVFSVRSRNQVSQNPDPPAMRWLFIEFVQVLVCMNQNSKQCKNIFTKFASSNKYSLCINYDKACPCNATSSLFFLFISTIGHGLYLLEWLPIVCAYLHNIIPWLTTSCKE